MKRIYHVCMVFFLCLCLCSLCISVLAHSGRTDSNGGHTNHSTGEYHYHHGYSAHDHYDIDGDGDVDCPYAFDNRTGFDSGNNPSKSKNGQVNDTSKTIQKSFSTNVAKALLALFGVFLCFPIAKFLHYLLSEVIDHIFRNRTIPDKFYEVLLYFIWTAISICLIHLIIIL